MYSMYFMYSARHYLLYILSLWALSLGQTSVSSDNVIPHWSDDVMPCPQVITRRFCLYIHLGAWSKAMAALLLLLYILCTSYIPTLLWMFFDDELPPGADTPIHAGLDSMFIQTRIFLPPSLNPPSFLSICPSSLFLPPLSSLVWTSCNSWRVGTRTSLLLQCVSHEPLM